MDCKSTGITVWWKINWCQKNYKTFFKKNANQMIFVLVFQIKITIPVILWKLAKRELFFPKISKPFLLTSGSLCFFDENWKSSNVWVWKQAKCTVRNQPVDLYIARSRFRENTGGVRWTGTTVNSTMAKTNCIRFIFPQKLMDIC